MFCFYSFLEVHQILKANEIFLPTFEGDVVGSTMAMFRLQDTYNITARQIAKGYIKG